MNLIFNNQNLFQGAHHPFQTSFAAAFGVLRKMQPDWHRLLAKFIKFPHQPSKIKNSL
jgi:hypothetical protein